MKFLIEKYLIQTNIWVALCFTGLLGFFQLNLYHPVYSVWGLAFFGTLAVYNFTRIEDWYKFTHPQKKDISSIILTVSGCLGTLICLALRDFDIKTFIYLGILGLVSFLYSLPMKGLGLRYVPFLKLFLIATVWSGGSIGLIIIAHRDHFRYPFLFLAVFFFVIGITIPFDIRDSQKDNKELKTIPQVTGVEIARNMALISLIISGLLFFMESGNLKSFTLTWFLTLFISFVLVLNSTKNKSEFYYSFWMESCSLTPLLLYFIFRIYG